MGDFFVLTTQKAFTDGFHLQPVKRNSVVANCFKQKSSLFLSLAGGDMLWLAAAPPWLVAGHGHRHWPQPHTNATLAARPAATGQQPPLPEGLWAGTVQQSVCVCTHASKVNL